MYNLVTTRRFDADVQRLKRRGLNLDVLADFVDLLRTSDEVPLTKEQEEAFNIHPLEGNKREILDAHLDHPEDDWLLLYQVRGGELVLWRTGTHEEVLGLKRRPRRSYRKKRRGSGP